MGTEKEEMLDGELVNACLFAKDQGDPLWEEFKEITAKKKEIKKTLLEKYREGRRQNGTRNSD